MSQDTYLLLFSNWDTSSPLWIWWYFKNSQVFYVGYRPSSNKTIEVLTNANHLKMLHISTTLYCTVKYCLPYHCNLTAKILRYVFIAALYIQYLFTSSIFREQFYDTAMRIDMPDKMPMYIRSDQLIHIKVIPGFIMRFIKGSYSFMHMLSSPGTVGYYTNYWGREREFQKRNFFG